MRICALFVLALAGCGVLDSTKALNEQNEQAGAFIEEHSTQPEIREAGQDIRLNAQSIKRDIGEAERKLDYNRQNSATLRNMQAAELAAREARNSLIDQGLAAVASFFGLSTVYVWLKSAVKSKALKAVTKGIESLPEEAFNLAKNAILPEALKLGVADPLHSIVKANTPA